MNPISSQYVAGLLRVAPKGAVRGFSTARSMAVVLPQAPPLWYENDAVWAVPASGKPYPVAFSSVNGFKNFIHSIKGSFARSCLTNDVPAPDGPVPSLYQPPFSFNDVPGCFCWTQSSNYGRHGLSSESHPNSLLFCCAPSAYPYMRNIVAGLQWGGVAGVPSTTAPAYPFAGTTCVAPGTNGSQNVTLRYILQVPNRNDPSDALFPITIPSVDSNTPCPTPLP
jgi:hypothetical protein